MNPPTQRTSAQIIEDLERLANGGEMGYYVAQEQLLREAITALRSQQSVPPGFSVLGTCRHCGANDNFGLSPVVLPEAQALVERCAKFAKAVEEVIAKNKEANPGSWDQGCVVYSSWLKPIEAALNDARDFIVRQAARIQELEEAMAGIRSRISLLSHSEIEAAITAALSKEGT